jgi:lysosome membrane protein 2
VVIRIKYLDGLVQQNIDQQVELLPNSKGYESWRHAPAPVFAKFHFFNLNNPDAFKTGSKPNFTDTGPFVYREDKTKCNVSWNYDETEVQYNLRSLYILDEGLSVGDPKQVKITQVNTVVVALLHLIETHIHHKHEEEIIDLVYRLFVEDFVKESFIETRTVHEWLWGYDDHLLEDVQKIIRDINKYLHKDIPVPQSVMALQTNNSVNDSQGWSTVYTGKGNLSKIAWYKEWNNLTHINGWGADGGDLLGGEGVLFQPGLSRNDTVYAFISQLFRSGYFTYVEDTSIYGITLYRYSIPKEEMYNSSLNKANAKFYSFGLSGVLNLTTVFPMNAPVFASKPHFLDADPLFLANLTGLSPNRTLHDSYLDIEPNTGGALRAAKRIQININIVNNPYLSVVKNIHSVMFPVLYAAEEGNITEDLANEFKNTVYGEIDMIDNVFVGGIVASGVGVVFFLLLGCFVLMCHCCSCKSKDERGRRMNLVIGDERQPLIT